MKPTTETLAGRAVLLLCHVAGMLDLVILPLWIGAMMQTHALDPQQAGGLVTLFVLGVLISSLFFAPRFTRSNARVCAGLGYLGGAIGFLTLSQLDAFGLMAVVHGATGIAVGCALSFTHGTMGRSRNPHRMFAFAGLGVGIFAIAFFGGMPKLIAAQGAAGLFVAVAILLLCASIAAWVAFPVPPASLAPATPQVARGLRFSWTPVVLIGLAIGCFNTTESMAFAFAERIGNFRGFAPDQVALPFLIGGIVNLSAPVLAGVLQNRVVALYTAVAALIVHACLAVLLTTSSEYAGFAVGVALLPFMIVFGHNFVFGILARVDPTGRATALTPAMLMIGAAIGPILGGTLAKAFGYDSLAVASVVVAAIGVSLFAWTARIIPLERKRPALIAEEAAHAVAH